MGLTSDRAKVGLAMPGSGTPPDTGTGTGVGTGLPFTSGAEGEAEAAAADCTPALQQSTQLSQWHCLPNDDNLITCSFVSCLA